MNIKIKFLPYEKFKKLGFKSIIKDLKHGRIILIDAKLTATEETSVIEKTMETVSNTFSGIELGSLDFNNNIKRTKFDSIKSALAEKILGKKRGVTIIGPANIVRKIERNPKELLIQM